MKRLALIFLTVTGCASSKYAGGASLAEERFPRREELAERTKLPASLDVKKIDAVAVDSWALQGPFPSEASVVHVAAATPWELAIAQGAPAFGAALSADLQCFAREYAAFRIAKKSAPGNSLRDFMERRCGTTAVDIDVQSLQGDVPEAMTEAEWLSQWKNDLIKEAQSRVGATLTGLAVRREAGVGLAVMVSAIAPTRFTQAIPLIAPKGAIVLRGQLQLQGVERVEALINTGALGVSSCRLLEAVPLPDFAFECPVQASDVRTTIAIAAFEPGRLLGRNAGSFLVWPAGTAATTWTRPPGSTDVSDSEFNAKFLAAINAVREKASLPSLVEVPSQSAVAQQLAPHYFAAAFQQEDARIADVIALGMLAGWDVKKDIVSSGFGSQWLSGSRDLGVLMEFLLDDPFTRQSLTNPRAKLMSAAIVKDSGTSLGTIFSTYVPLETFNRKESEIAIITHLNQMRLDHGLPLAQWTLWPEDEGALVAQKLADRSWDPGDAANHVLHKTALLAKGEVSGYVQLVDDLDHFQFPQEVLLRANVNVFLAVGTYKAETWAQTRYVVCFVLARTGDIETASRD